MECPDSLFPGFHRHGPPLQHPGPGLLGVFGGVQEDVWRPGQNGHRFIPLCDHRAETWSPAPAGPTPLLPPNTDGGVYSPEESHLVYKKIKHQHSTNLMSAGVTLNFSLQMGFLARDQADLAFRCMGRLLEPHFHLTDSLEWWKPAKQHPPRRRVSDLQSAVSPDCPFPSSTYPVRAFSCLTRDWLPDLPPATLGPLLHRSLTEDWRNLQYREATTGGALCWAAFPESSSASGCLIYPRGAALNQLHFQQVSLGGSGVTLQGDPAVFTLQHPILQVSSGEPGGGVYVGVRSLYNAAAWSFSPDLPPRALGVVRTKSPSTCVAVSPHLPGELTVCTEAGGVYLWSLETAGLRRVRYEPETLFFQDDPHWRWSDFTSHPRVLLYADRTGAQTADTRVDGATGLDLFRIGEEASCQKGERLILARCLRETDPTHYVVTTQFSVFIMDERFPLVPIAKWTHMLKTPPPYLSLIPANTPSRTNKLLLGAQHNQETLLLQYSGGMSSPCQLHLPAVRLLQNMECLHHLDPILPHHHDLVTQRLSSPLAGLVAAYVEDAPKSLIVFQLTEAGDVFSQKLGFKAPGSAHEDLSTKSNPTGESSEASPSTHSGVTENGPLDDPIDPKEQGSMPEAPLPNMEEDSGTAPQPSSGDPAYGSGLSCQEEISLPHEPEGLEGDGAPTFSLRHEDEEWRHRGDGSPVSSVPHDAGDDQSSVSSLLHKAASTSASPLARKSRRSLRRWIQALIKASRSHVRAPKRPGCHINQLFSSVELRESAVGPEATGLRERLRQSMKSGGLIRLDPLPVPDTTELAVPKARHDWTSQRLTAAWCNQLPLWWDEHLGLNKASKIQALREKRRRQKQLRARSQTSLSGSFSSSFSGISDSASVFGSDSDPFSDADAWSCSAFSDTQRSETSVDVLSMMSFQSGPCVRPNRSDPRMLPATSETAEPRADPGVPPATSETAEPRSDPGAPATSDTAEPRSDPLIPLQYLRSKGVPRERAKTLQSFLTSFREEPDPPGLSQSLQPSTASQLHGLSQSASQPQSAPSRTQEQSDGRRLQNVLPPRLSQASQLSGRQTPSQQPPKKKSRMGF